MCSYLPRATQVGEAGATEQARRTPFLFLHGADDVNVLLEDAQRHAKLLQEALGAANVEFRRFDGVGHVVAPAISSAAVEWIARRLGDASL